MNMQYISQNISRIDLSIDNFSEITIWEYFSNILYLPPTGIATFNPYTITLGQSVLPPDSWYHQFTTISELILTQNLLPYMSPLMAIFALSTLSLTEEQFNTLKRSIVRLLQNQGSMVFSDTLRQIRLTINDSGNLSPRSVIRRFIDQLNLV